MTPLPSPQEHPSAGESDLFSPVGCNRRTDAYGGSVERRARLLLDVVAGVTQGSREVPAGFDLQVLRRAFVGPYIANNGYDLALALEARRANRADLISFGRPYIANPDLVERLRTGASLNTPDRATFFGGGAHGYTDYPFMENVARVAAGAVR